MIATANIASTPKGLILIYEEKNLLNILMNSMLTAVGELKVSSLRTLSCLLSHSDLPDCEPICKQVCEIYGILYIY